MRVLWFSNTPCSADEYLGNNSIRGGWLKSLEIQVNEIVDLGVVFEYPKFSTRFKYGNTEFFPVSRKNWKLFILLKNLFGYSDIKFKKQKCLSIIHEFKPDLVHIHGLENIFADLIGDINIPVVTSIQGSYLGYYRKFSSDFDIRLLKRRHLKFAFTIKYFKALIFEKSYYNELEFMISQCDIERNTYRLNSYLIGRTDWDKRLSKVLAPNAKYFHNNEVLRDLFYSNRWQLELNKDDKMIIFTTGGRNTFKGLITIFETISELVKSNFLNFEWRIAGVNSDDQIITLIQKQLKSVNLDKLVFIGNLNELELINELKKAHLFVQSSKIENSPNSLCEAMILGMPCIATYAGGTSSLIDDKIEGILIQDGDPFAMAGSIIELREDFELAKNFGNAARNRALIRHDKKKIVDDLLSIYKNILIKN
jgi:glycosyltransferase involved in cell wall biosynthesis